MKAKLIVDNREIEVEIPEEELSEIKKKTGYERATRPGTKLWFENYGRVEEYNDSLDFPYDVLYNCANYYSSRDGAGNNIRADKLMRQLRRFAVENRKNPLDWEVNNNQRKYFIYYGTSDIFEEPELKIDYCFEDRHFGVIYFDTKEAAQKAIEIFHDKLIWYFTEYKDSL